MNLILIAPPAAGKGTFASMLNKKYGLVCISAGELLRGVDPTTELGKKIRELQSRRELVDDHIINKLIEERLSKEDIKNGFILDGYPRHLPQITLLNDSLNKLGLNIDYAVVLNVDYDTALKRTLGRRICPKCKKTYNTLTGCNIPKVENKCDDCGSLLEIRNDDNEESLKKGMEFYNKETAKVAHYYKSKDMLIEIDSNTSTKSALEEFEKAIGL